MVPSGGVPIWIGTCVGRLCDDSRRKYESSPLKSSCADAGGSGQCKMPTNQAQASQGSPKNLNNAFLS
ncbi:hypothetical protein VTO42DRAFT_4943 [Malbranchea cinnamomea]